MAEAQIGDDEKDPEQRFSFSRCSSAGSIHTSSANNSEDEDVEDSDHGNHLSYKDRRREAHTQAEQKRRNAINQGYELLQELVPTCQKDDQNQGHKMSKALVLQKSIDYIQFTQKEKRKQEEEVASLQKEMLALTILKLNYEQIVALHQNQPGQTTRQIPDEIKFQVFAAVMDSLFKSFDQCTSTGNFAEISGSVISWVEEHCKPEILREIMVGVLQQLSQQEANLIAASNYNPDV